MEIIQKSLLFLSGMVLCVTSGYAQPWPRKSEFVKDNNKRLTDSNVSLYNIHSEYDFPYLIPSAEDVREKLLRICAHLERSTMDRFIDGSTGQTITDLKKLPRTFVFGEGDYRPYSYEWGVTYSGMLAAALATGRSEFRTYTDKRLKMLAEAIPIVRQYMNADAAYRSPISPLMNPHDLDACGALCAASIRASITGGDYDLRYFIDNSLDYISNGQFRLEDGTLARKRPYENTLWADDLYMGVPALAQGYLLTGKNGYLDDAVKQVIQLSARMCVESTGLYMHSWVSVMDPHPAFYWGRANGWITLAICDLLDAMPKDHPERMKILELFRGHCQGIARVQSRNGMWRQLLDRNDSYEESSCTAMFVYGLARGVNEGWLDTRVYGPVALLGWNGLSEQITNEGQIDNVCVGTGVAFDAAYYYHRHVHPYTGHGYGATLMAGSEIIRLVRNFNIEQDTAIFFHERKQQTY